jgi:hypothetical protein
MKVVSIYINKKYFAEKLGIKENQFVLGDIEADSNEIQFKIFIDNDAEVKESSQVSESHSGWNIRRQTLDSI